MKEIAHVLVLNLHQPAPNLEYLLAHHSWEAMEILYALDRIPRSLRDYEYVGRVHLSLSGTLLETLSNPVFLGVFTGLLIVGCCFGIFSIATSPISWGSLTITLCWH